MSRKFTARQTIALAALACGLALAAPGGGTPALAQGADDDVAIEEIIVTAQKRTQSLQKVAISVTVLGADEIRESRIYRMDEIGARTPGFNVTLFSVGQPGLTMRGIGSNEDGAGGDNSVAVFLDGVYMARGASQVFDLFDLERVEILRGPQGTLYGKNVIGGAVNIVTSKPSDEFRVRGQGTVGNFNRIDLKAMASGPLSDNVLAKFAFSSRDRDGHTISLSTGNDVMDENTTSARAQLLFILGDAAEFLISADYSRDRLAGDARIPIGGTAGPVADAAGGGVNNPRNSLSDVDGLSERDLWGIHGTLEWDTGLGRLTSITAFRRTDFDWVTDPLGLTDLNGIAPFFILGTLDGDDKSTETSKQFSQEIRLASTEGQRLTWVGGLYYLHENAVRVEIVQPVVDISNVLGFPLGTVPPFQSLNIFDQKNILDSFAVFGEATFAVTDKLNVTGGLRYTNEKKNYDFEGAGTIAPVGSTLNELFIIDVSKQWDALTWKAGVDYAASGDVLFFASVTRGFKSGGFQGQPPSEEFASQPFDPEFAIDYELGVKSQWMDDRVRLNISGFYIDYTDLQIAQFIATPTNPVGNFTTLNAGKATIWGFEAEWIFRPAPWVEFSGSYGYLNTEVKEFGNDAAAIGENLANSPKHSLSVSVDMNRPVGENGTISMHWNFRHISESNDDIPAAAITAIPAYTVVDTRLTYTLDDRNLDISFWAKNLFDETYRLQVFDVAGSGFALFAPPRMWGFTVSWRYD